jgi:hypothetical protein
MTLSTMTFSLTTFSIMMLGIKGLYVILSINDTQQCHVLFIVILNVRVALC